MLFSVANVLCRNEEYRLAIPVWEKAFEAQEKPRFTDYHESIALRYMRLGEPKNARKAYQKILDILRDEWGIRFSSYVDDVKEKMEMLS